MQSGKWVRTDLVMCVFLFLLLLQTLSMWLRLTSYWDPSAAAFDIRITNTGTRLDRRQVGEFVFPVEYFIWSFYRQVRKCLVPISEVLQRRNGGSNVQLLRITYNKALLSVITEEGPRLTSTSIFITQFL